MTVRGAVATILFQPWRVPQRVTVRWRKRIRKKRYRQLRDENATDFAWIHEILDRYHTAGGYDREWQDLKLFELWRTLLDESPANILELGSGCSSAVFAKYAKQNGARYTSVDQSEHWSANARQLSGVTDSDDNIEFLVSDASSTVCASTTEFKYTLEFSGPYDLVFIDGPMHYSEGQHVDAAVSSNIFDIVAVAPPKLVLVDLRHNTVRAMKERLGRDYEWTDSDMLELEKHPVGDPVRWYTAFRRINQG